MAAIGTLTIDCPVAGCDTKLDIELEVGAFERVEGHIEGKVFADLGGVVDDHFHDKHGPK